MATTQVTTYDMEDWTTFIDGGAGLGPNGHTVDVGAGSISPTHVTRDGFPMEVMHDPTLGYLVAVDTTAPIGARPASYWEA